MYQLAECGCFNPRPPLPGSDAQAKFNLLTTCPVSIHAPRCRGAMRAKAIRPAMTPFGFNPRPPLPGSDAEAGGRVEAVDMVSIHAPRCRGAMP